MIVEMAAAAAVIVSLVVVHHKVGGQFVVYSQSAIAILVLDYIVTSLDLGQGLF